MKIDIKRETAEIVVKALLAVTDQLIITGSTTEAATLREIAGDLDEQIRIDKLAERLRKFNEKLHKSATYGKYPNSGDPYPGNCICPSCNRERGKI